MFVVDDLLAPVTSENFCGENLEKDSRLIALTQEGLASAEVKWPKVIKQASSLFAETKDLSLASALIRGAINTHSFQSLLDAFIVLNRILTEHWDCLYPPLDPDEKDSIERVSTLAVLWHGPTIIPEFNRMQLVSSKAYGAVTLKMIHDPDDNSDAKITEIFSQAGAELVVGNLQLASQVMDQVKKLNTNLDDLCEGHSEDISVLMNCVSQIKEVLDGYAAKLNFQSASSAETGKIESDADNGEAIAAIAAQSANSPQGYKIRSRQDIVTALDEICIYLNNHEPSSPIPILLQRAKSLISKSFLDIVGDLIPDSLKKVKEMGGKTSE